MGASKSTQQPTRRLATITAKSSRRTKLKAKELVELSGKKPVRNSLFWKLWNANLETAKKALNTPYIQGIKRGDLDPRTYGFSVVNDAYYCFHGGRDYMIAAERKDYKDEILKVYIQEKAKSYQDYNEEFKKMWHLKSAESVTPMKITREYADYETQVVSAEKPIYTLIVNLPCEWLWSWLAMQLDGDDDKPKTNLYDFWIQDNKDPSGAFKMGNCIEYYMRHHPDQVDVDKAMEMYSKAMMYELQGFEASCE